MNLDELLKIDFDGDIKRAMSNVYNFAFDQGRNKSFLNFNEIRSVLANSLSVKETDMILEEFIRGFMDGSNY